MSTSEKKIQEIRKQAKDLLLKARRKDDLDNLIADMVEDVVGIKCGRIPQVVWSRSPKMRQVRIYIPGELGFITVNADDDS